MRRLLAAAALLAVLYVAWYRETRGPTRSAHAPPVPLLVPQGASAAGVGRQLHALGLVRHPAIFRAVVFLRGDGARLRAGEYSLEGPLSLDQIVDLLVKGEVARRDVTFPEGRNLVEMAGLVEAYGVDGAAFLAACGDPSAIRDLDPEAPDLEGYLFPDTYDVPRRADAAPALVARMVERFRQVLAPELPVVAQGRMTLREVVTVASLVELETARGEERPRIAAVFLNRLKKRMLLQTDPTVIYALKKAGTWDGNIRKRDLDLDSPYNTYRRPGLPPGPIASPGREALLAVLHPAPVKDLYFVSRNDGTHEFNETLAQHERAVDRYQRRRGRGGA
ncbi:MAG: endolytic transglycosylase MltG [Acidobacteria bacterium]|nr:endolytic transglycosylase MltG [Acidobacteriota bacterium]